jgi:hypothetical protein
MYVGTYEGLFLANYVIFIFWAKNGKNVGQLSFGPFQRGIHRQSEMPDITREKYQNGKFITENGHILYPNAEIFNIA